MQSTQNKLKLSLCLCSNYAVDFVGNIIVDVQQSPFTVTSSAQVAIRNTTFVNVLCQGSNTEFFSWASPGSIISLANVDDVTISGSKIHNNERCSSPQGNYAQPVSMVNATNVRGVGLSKQPSAATFLKETLQLPP